MSVHNSSESSISDKVAEGREKRGECMTCGQKCYTINRFKRSPLTMEGLVLNGRCLLCKPVGPNPSFCNKEIVVNAVVDGANTVLTDDKLFVSMEKDNGGRLKKSEFPSALPNLSMSNLISLSSVDKTSPGWIDIYDCSQTSRYTTVYAFTIDCNTRTIFRTYDSFSSLFSKSYAHLKQNFSDMKFEFCLSPRLSRAERRRRLMGIILNQFLQENDNSTQVYTFTYSKDLKYDSEFLQRFAAKSPAKGKMEGLAARALSERHWVEEWVVLSNRHVDFFQPPPDSNMYKKRPVLRIPMDKILNVEKIKTAESPNFSGFYFFSIETLGKTVYIMLPNEEQRDSWVSFIVHVLESSENSCASSSPSNAWEYSIANEPSDEFLHKSSIWDCKKRRVLNCHKFIFNSSYVEKNASELVERAMQIALQPMQDDETPNLRDFLDIVAELKAVSVMSMSEPERVAFFINLYNVLITHAFLLLGPPSSSLKWISYFNIISYQCSDDIFSLTELEHCIIRASMSKPSQFVSKYVLPKSQYQFALTTSDFRINFALNCGSLSNPKHVLIYNHKNLDKQLDCATRLYLKDSVNIIASSGKVTIFLPKVCEWFNADFDEGQNKDIVQKLLPYFPEDCYRKQLSHLLAQSSPNSKSVSIKFLPYSFQCRNLTLYREVMVNVTNQDIETPSEPFGKEQGQAVHAVPVNSSNPGQPIAGYPNPDSNHIPSVIIVDDDDVSSLGDYTAGRSKFPYSTVYELKPRDAPNEEPRAHLSPYQGSIPTGTVRRSKTRTSGREGALAPRGPVISQEEDFIGSSSKPESATETVATMSQMPSGIDRCRDIGTGTPFPSSASTYTYFQSEIMSPPGELGIILANCSDGHSGTSVNSVRRDGPLYNILEVGDRIIAVDGEDVSFLTVEELKEVLSNGMDRQRQLTVVSPIRCDA